METSGGAARLLGRDREMAVLRERLDDARAGRPSMVLVAGDAGIGKTRLLTELADASPDRVLWGACLPLGERGVPYLALIDILRSFDASERDLLPPALEMLTPRGRGAAGSPAASRSHLFQSVIDLLDELAARQPLLVVIEDIHWADPSTRDLLDFLMSLLRDQRILLVVSFRTDDLPTDHPLRVQLAEWLRRPRVWRLDLDALSDEDGLRLVLPRLSGSPLTRARPCASSNGPAATRTSSRNWR